MNAFLAVKLNLNEDGRVVCSFFFLTNISKVINDTGSKIVEAKAIEHRFICLAHR